MRKVTVWRMRERYAQMVLTFRITHVFAHKSHFIRRISCTSSYILIIVQRDSTKSSQFIILEVHSTCFGCQPHPSSGVHKTVTTACGTGHIFCAATSFQLGQNVATLGHAGV